MKKVFLVGILTILCVSATFAQMRFGATAGLNTSNFAGDIEDSKFKAGLQAGIVMDLAINQSFSIVPELLFSQRGSKYDGLNLLGVKANFSETLNYLQLPVNAAYKFDVGYGSKVFVFAGPYLGYAISGKTKMDVSAGDKDHNRSESIDFGSKAGETNPFDFGLNIGVGYQYQKIFFKLQYNHGLTNLSNSDNFKQTNTNIGVSAGYFFN